MESGVYSNKGTVVKITPDGVYVKIRRRLSLEREEILRFDNEGKSCDGQGTFECGPWEIKPEDMLGKW